MIAEGFWLVVTGTTMSFVPNRSHSRIFSSPRSSSISRITSFFCRASTDRAARATTVPRSQGNCPFRKVLGKSYEPKNPYTRARIQRLTRPAELLRRGTAYMSTLFFSRVTHATRVGSAQSPRASGGGIGFCRLMASCASLNSLQLGQFGSEQYGDPNGCGGWCGDAGWLWHMASCAEPFSSSVAQKIDARSARRKDV
jgi:hypothetical protein